jgi:hypothetical protein
MQAIFYEKADITKTLVQMEKDIKSLKLKE